MLAKGKYRWHISYFSDKDKDKIEKVMKQVGCKDYELHQGIDECIICFEKRGKRINVC